MNSPSYKSRLFAAGIGLLLIGGVHTSVWAESTCRADVVFAMDNTGSMGGIIRSTTAAAKRLVKGMVRCSSTTLRAVIRA